MGVSAPARGAREDAPRALHRAARPWLGAAALAAGAAAVILAVYLAHPLLRGYRLPLGPDGPVYAWWARYAEVAGLGGARRPGVPGLTLVLGAGLGTSPLRVLTVLGPVLAAAAGLAAAALVEAALGPSRGRALAAAGLTAAFAGFLAPGWLANLALVALFLGGAAALALAEGPTRAAALAAALLAAGGLAHAPFLVVGAVVLTGVVLWHAPEALRRVRGGEPPGRTAAVRIAAATLAGVAGALLALAALPARRAPGDTSQDHFLRRAGLDEILLARFRERLADEGRRMAPPLGAAALLAVPGSVAAVRDRGGRYLVGLAVAWAAVTAGGVAVLWWTGAGPASRLLSFAFFLPVLAAAGLHASLRARGRRPWVAASAVLAALVLAGGSLWGWYRQRPFVEAEEARAAAAAGRVVAGFPAGTPVVFLVDTPELAASFHVARFGNVIRAGLPPGRIADAHVAVGRPGDFLAGRLPPEGMDPEYEGVARQYLEDVAPLRGRAAVLVVRAFNREAFPEALALGVEVAPGVVVLRGPGGAAPEVGTGASSPRPPAPPAPEGPGPLGQAGLALGALALLGALGGGWARWGLPGASPLAVASLAPSAGAAVGILGALAADRLGLPPGSGGALAAVGVLGGLGYLAARALHEPVQPPPEPRRERPQGRRR